MRQRGGEREGRRTEGGRKKEIERESERERDRPEHDQHRELGVGFRVQGLEFEQFGVYGLSPGNLKTTKPED